ncbi:MAG TPA: hypothetical protein VF198_16450 [Vicinamibacterales bacterium]
MSFLQIGKRRRAVLVRDWRNVRPIRLGFILAVPVMLLRRPRVCAFLPGVFVRGRRRMPGVLRMRSRGDTGQQE